MQIDRNKRLQYKINSAIMFVLLFAAAAMLAWMSHRYEQQFDWTAAGRHSLSSASIAVLKRIEGPIEITSYASKDVELRKNIRDILKRYQKVKPDISLEFIDQAAVPDQLRELGISIDGELIVRYQDRSEHVKTGSESDITNALERLARGTERWLAFVSGHGERDPLGDANHDLGLWVQNLNQRGYKSQSISLTELDQIPDNTAALILASPRVDLLAGEVEKIVNYVRAGGNLLWLLEPGPMHGLEALAKELQIEVHPGTVIDFVGQLMGVDDPTIAIATGANYSPHPSLSNFSLTTLFPGLSPIVPVVNESWTAEPLIISGDHTWSEVGELSGEVQYDDGLDEPGPVNIIVSLSRALPTEGSEAKQQRVLIAGDGDFIANQYVANVGNMDLGVRLINWLSGDDAFIDIPANTADDLYVELFQ